MTVQISFKMNDWVFHTGPMIWAICALADVSVYLDILILRFFKKKMNDGASSILTWVSADTASAACPAHPGSFATTSFFAAVICDADDLCSVNTAYDPASSFTMSPRSTTLPLYF